MYIFLAIGTALAAGVQALGIAAIATTLFNYLVLGMWKYRFGDPPAPVNSTAHVGSRLPRMPAKYLANAGTKGYHRQHS